LRSDERRDDRLTRFQLCELSDVSPHLPMVRGFPHPRAQAASPIPRRKAYLLLPAVYEHHSRALGFALSHRRPLLHEKEERSELLVRGRVLREVKALGQELNSLDAKRAHTGNRLHWLELQPDLLETDLREQCHQPCADLFDLALRPGSAGLENDGYHSAGFKYPPHLLYPHFLIWPELPS
jgi:hypothetical protein